MRRETKPSPNCQTEPRQTTGTSAPLPEDTLTEQPTTSSPASSSALSAALRAEQLEPRILRSVTWINAATGDINPEATDQADIFMGDTADNVVDGLDGDDVISTFAGDDTLLGGAGDDTLDGGVGDDLIDGGAGNDTASYAGISRDVDVNLATGTATGEGGNDTLINIENVIGSTANDHITGDAQDNILDGGAGNDVLEGGAGDDQLIGGSGDDTASYASATDGVSVDLDAGTASGGAGNDTLISIENAIGSAHDDTLSGNEDANTLDGGAGNDTLEGGGGDDTLIGGEGTDTAVYSNASDGVTVNLASGTAGGGDGSDTLSGIENVVGSDHDDTLVGDSGANVLAGGGGDDVLIGGLGDDSLDGGSGVDTASYASVSGSLNVNLSTGEATGAAGHDTLTNIENVTGGSGNDQITGDAQDNVLSGGSGNDVLDGGTGDDTLYGGTGSDTASYASADGSVDVNLADGTADGAAGHDTLVSIENTTGSSYDDHLVGSSKANQIDGGAGDDDIEGGAGNDTLIGGDGTDTVHYDNATAAVNVNLASGSATGGDGSDTLSGFENVVGSSFNDTLTGDGGANTLSGGAGDDTLDGGAGNDVLDGGDGIDTASYASMSGSVNVNLATGVATGAAGTDSLTNIENVIGGSGYDTLTGDAQNNILQGGSGGDTLNGGLGDDILDGGSGTDMASYATANGSVDVNLETGTASGADGNDSLNSIEYVTGSAYDDHIVGDANGNYLVGGDGDDVIDGGAGNDTIDGGAGNDTLTGGAGTDTLRYSSANDGVTADLAAGTATGTDGEDTFDTFENLTGSNYDDALYGDGNANTLSGSSGNDILDGRGGNDTLDGGSGDDTLIGGAGTDTANYSGAGSAVTVDLTAGTASGGAGNDTLSQIENVTGSRYDDTLIGDHGDNVLVGGSGDDIIDGQGGTDTVSYSSSYSSVDVNLAQGTATGAAGNDTLLNIENVTGGSGADTLTGDDGKNVLSGGSGNDVLNGGLGNDTLSGGSGTDTASYADASGDVTVNLATGKATGAAGTDTLSSIEDVRGSEYNDTITGNSGSNTIEGGAGDDVIDGGSGTDTASYANASGSVNANLATGSASGAAGNDTLTRIENLTGSAFDDALTGDGNANVLTGGLGNDTLDGGAGTDTASYAGSDGAVNVNLAEGTADGAAGNDTLVNIENVVGSDYADTLTGDDGANTLSGGTGDDTLDGGLGNDTLDGGSGTDTASYARAEGGVTVNLATGNASGAAGEDTLTSVENVTGSDYADNLTGDAGANVLIGGAGDDVLNGGAGNDILDGGSGHDTADYSTAGSAVKVDLTKVSAQSTGGAGTDTLISIESVVGSNYNDTFAFSQPTDGAHYTVDGNGGTNTIDLSNYSRDDVSVDKAAGTITVQMSDGQQFSVDYTNISSLKFADGTVLTTDTAPVASAGADQNVDGGAFVTLDGSATHDADGDLLQYSWTQTAGPAVELSATDAVSPTFTAPDGYVNVTMDFQIQVSDGTHVSTDTVQIVANRDDSAPAADAGPDQGVTEGDVVHLDGRGTDPLGNGVTYEWVQTSGPTVELSDPHAADPTFTTPQLETSTPLTFELHVTDGAKTSIDTVNVFVNAQNDGPTADAGQDQIVDEHATVSLNASGSSDPDSPNLTYHWTQTGGPQVELSDSESAQPSFTAPSLVEPAVCTFELQVSDGQTVQTDTVSVTVNPVNVAPDAQADQYEASEDNAVQVDASHGVLANDSDADGNDLSAALAQDAEHGHVELNGDGSFTYTPDANFNGTDQFTYEVSDGYGGVQTATATITVAGANDAPTAADSEYAGTEDNPVQADASQGVLANADDIDGDVLSATLAQDAEHGHVELNADGSFTYTPNADFNGTDQFTYEVSDGHGGVQTATATITVAAVEDGNHAEITPPTDPGQQDPVVQTPPTNSATEPTDSTPTQPGGASEDEVAVEPEIPQDPDVTDPDAGVTDPVDDKIDDPIPPQDTNVTEPEGETTNPVEDTPAEPDTPADTNVSEQDPTTTASEPTTSASGTAKSDTAGDDSATKPDSLETAVIEHQAMLDAAERTDVEPSAQIETPDVVVTGRDIAAAASAPLGDSVPTQPFEAIPNQQDEVPAVIQSASESQPDTEPEHTTRLVDLPVEEASNAARPVPASPGQQLVGAAAAVGIIADASYLTVGEVEGDRRTFLGRDRDGSDSRRRSGGSATLEAVFGVRNVEGTRSAFASPPQVQPADTGNATSAPASDNTPTPVSEPSSLRYIWRKLTQWL